MRRATPPRQRGFTLTEMLVVVLILGILAAIAAPNMTQMVRTQRVKTAAFDIYSSLNLARSEALKRNRSITITPNNGDWAKGWVAVDSDGNTIKTQGGWDALTLSGPNSVVFDSRGRANAFAQMSLNAAGLDVSAQRCITLDLSGRATSKDGAC